MSRNSFGRDDMKKFIRSYKEDSWDSESGSYRLLSECGCEEAPQSLYGESTGEMVLPDPILASAFAPMQEGLSTQAPCPDSYNTAADYLVQVPHELVEMIKPMMQDLGIGCPASLARAMGDVLTTSQDLGVTGHFNPEMPVGMEGELELEVKPDGEIEVSAPIEIDRIDLAIEEALKKFKK